MDGITGIKLRGYSRLIARDGKLVSTSLPGIKANLVGRTLGFFGGGDPNLYVRDIRSDCRVVVTQKLGDIMFGSPPEIIKKFKLDKRPVPQTVVLGPDFIKDGFLINELEFPCYDNFFLSGRKFRIVGTKEMIDRARIILSQSIFGPDEAVEGKAERDYFRKDQKTGKPLQLGDIIEFVEINGKEVEINGVKIVQINKGVFSIIEDGSMLGTVNTNSLKPFREAKETFRKNPFDAPRFGLTFMGTSSGFDPYHRTTSLILWANGKGIFVDPLADPEGEMNKQGIASKDVPYVLLTHCHADHDVGVLRRILNGEKVKLITSKVIYESFLKKAEAMIGFHVRDYIDLVEANPGDEIEIEGVKLKISSALHSIPTIRFKAEYTENTPGGTVQRKIAYAADTYYNPEKMEELKTAGVISAARLRELREFVENGDYDLLVHETYVPPIHTPPECLGQLPEPIKPKIRIVHTGSIPENLGLRMASQGETIAIIPSSDSEIRVLEAIAGNSLFGVLPLRNVMQITRQAKVVSFGMGERIIRAGTPGDKFYIMISGKVRVNAGEDTLAVLEKGDYFGETALLKDVPRTANIDALSDGRLLVIEGDAFRELMNQLPQLAESLRNIPTIRSLLKQVTFLEKLPADKLALLASRFKLKAYKPGTALIEQGTRGRSFFVITEGEVDIVVKSLDGREKLIAQRGAGSVMGEISLIKGVPTTATVQARGAVKALVLDEATFKELCQEIPGLRFNLDQVGEERLKELSGKD